MQLILQNTFTFDYYQTLLETLQEDSFTFILEPDALKSTKKSIINRHDIDFHPPYALRTGLIEESLGIKSSYYFLLDSLFYNAFSKDVINIIHQLKEMGHSVNLHFDSTSQSCRNLNELESRLNSQKLIWRSVFGFELDSFTFHMNNDFTKNCNAEYYSGLLNAGLLARQPLVSYISDSNGFWASTPQESTSLEIKDSLLLLTHPEWWNDKKLTTHERFNFFLDEKRKALSDWYEDVLKIHNRPFPGKS